MDASGEYLTFFLPAPRLGRPGVLLGDRIFDQLAAACSRLVRTLDFRHSFGQRLVLDGLSDPRGVITLLQMKEPGLIINPLRDLQEHRQVLCFQVQLVFWSPEVEALFLYVILGVLATMTQPLSLAGFHGNAHLTSIGLVEP